MLRHESTILFPFSFSDWLYLALPRADSKADFSLTYRTGIDRKGPRYCFAWDNVDDRGNCGSHSWTLRAGFLETKMAGLSIAGRILLSFACRTGHGARSRDPRVQPGYADRLGNTVLLDQFERSKQRFDRPSCSRLLKNPIALHLMDQRNFGRGNCHYWPVAYTTRLTKRAIDSRALPSQPQFCSPMHYQFNVGVVKQTRYDSPSKRPGNLPVDLPY